MKRTHLSGTEPKMKFYFGVKGRTLTEAKQQLEQLETAMMACVFELIGGNFTDSII
ncbi:hypothetical protein JV16_01325 [Anoxybacillus ayderensis]|uniref:Uncharacterized protein n=1 Tax=Anoxybacillus ayderensis TaxID=265546 RepID=A0A0D0H0T0_9BACL|nr:hypothetical protein [Anoxybacillus ayderensis]KIP21646.1 hypothetical protein JV16_01325 [Anoxybacillus ayderensis]